MSFMRFIFFGSLVCLGTSTLAQSEGSSTKENGSSSTLQKHLEKHSNSGWSCILRKKHYRADSPEDEAKCGRLGGKFKFAKDLKRDAPTLDQIESSDSKSERQHQGY